MSRYHNHIFHLVIGILSWICLCLAAQSATAAETVLRAKLDNGLRVVIIRNPLAPVVATSMNYLVGSNEAPKGFPGTAHAVEHMMFRGSPGLSQAQLSNIGGMMGGNYNAETREGMTQYYYTVPAEDLDVALHIEASRMQGLTSDEADWDKERGAIEQEVAGDHSAPLFKAMEDVRAQLFAGTFYAHSPLGTRESFDKTDIAALKKFHDTWYAPNNAVLIVVGKVDPQKALARIKDLFGKIPAKTLPQRPVFQPSPIEAKDISLPFDRPYQVVYKAIRLPGLASEDFPALEILEDVLQSKRFALYTPVLEGKAFITTFAYHPLKQAGWGQLVAAIPAGADGTATLKMMNDILADAVKKGIPADLVEAAKLQEKRVAAQSKNSISGQASDWADALCMYGYASPDAYLDKVEKVSVADVNRVAKKYLHFTNAITVELKPQPGMKPVKGRTGGAETIAMPQGGAVKLPDWAKAAMGRLEVPQVAIKPTVSHLKNGITLYVVPTDVSDSIELHGYIRNNADMQAPKGKEGMDALLDQMMDYGTTHLNRLQFQSAQDAIGADIHAGTTFSARALSRDFAKAVALLADAEENPAFPEQYLNAIKPQQAKFVADQKKTPNYQAEMAKLHALLPASDPELRVATAASVMSVTREDLLAYHKAVFRPDMTGIVVIGNITPDKAKAIVEKYFGSWTATGPKPDVDYPAVPDNKGADIHIANPVRMQDSVSLTQMLKLTRKSPDYFALQMGNAVLGGGIFSSKLLKDLRTDNGLVYSAGSSFRADQHRSVFMIGFGSDPGNADKAVKLALKDVADMQAKPVDAKVLRDTKAYVLRQLALGESSFTDIAEGYLNRFDDGLPVDEVQRAAAAYIALTAKDVQKACQKWLRPKDMVRITLGPKP